VRSLHTVLARERVKARTATCLTSSVTKMFPPPQPKQGYQDVDASIRLTDADAALARLSAVQKGYLEDPFVKSMVPRAHLQPPRPPLINVGTFIRSTAIDNLVYGWLELVELAGKSCQIVSLGAGSDTRFWRLAVRLHSGCFGGPACR
jgi:[phosphatase 2A protein]-leucine-carboxy methyltransferase